MNVFDGNQHLLMIKAEMASRKDFTGVALVAQLIFGVLAIATGLFVQQITGAVNLFECIKPRSNLTHTLTCLLILCSIAWFLLNSQDMHSSM